MTEQHSAGAQERAAAPLIAAAVFAAGLCAIWLIELTGPRHLAGNLLASYLVLWTCVLLVARAPRRRVAARFLLITLGLGLGLLCVEGVVLLGLVDARRLVRRGDAGQFKISDAELGFRRRPNSQITMRYYGNAAGSLCLPADPSARRYEVRWDRHGFRNGSDLTEAHVTVLGDSYVEALELSEEELMTTLLARRLGATVANLGLQGYGPWEMLAVLRRYALPLEPRVVVWMFFEGNDVSDLRGYHHERRPPRGGVSEPEALSLRRAVEGSFAYGALQSLFDALCPRRPSTDHVLAVFRDGAGRSQPMYLDTGSIAVSNTDLAQVRTILREALDRTRAQGSRLLVVFVPLKLRVYRDLVEAPRGSAWFQWHLDESLPARFERMVTSISSEVAYLDLTAPFLAAARAGQLVYLPDDSHWSPEGHRVAAEAIAARLSRSP